MIRLICFISILVFIQLVPARAGDRPTGLNRNPFSPPKGLYGEKKEVPQKMEHARNDTPKTVRKEALGLHIYATLIGGGSSMANINGTMLKRGDTLQGFLLVDVQGDAVVLEKKGVYVTLSMWGKKKSR